MKEPVNPTLEDEVRGYDSLPDYKVFFHHIYHDYPIFHSHSKLKIWEFAVVTLGQFRHVINGQEKILKKGDAFLIRPEDNHALFKIGDEPIGHINIGFDIDTFKNHCDSISDDLYNKLINLADTSTYVNDQFVDKLNHYCMFFKSDMHSTKEIGLVDGLIINMIIDLYCEQVVLPSRKYPDWLDKLILEINSNKNANWTVDDVLKHSNYSHAQLIRLFKKYTGSTINDYLKKAKISFACDMLQHTNMSIQEISYELGYASVNNFNPLFKKAIGVAPLAFRKSHNKDFRDDKKS